MKCSDVGAEIFVFLLFASAAVVLLTVRPRTFQDWLRKRDRRWLWPLPAFVLEGHNVWMFRAVGLIPLVMWVAALAGVYCFFHGPDLPPIQR